MWCGTSQGPAVGSTEEIIIWAPHANKRRNPWKESLHPLVWWLLLPESLPGSPRPISPTELSFLRPSSLFGSLLCGYSECYPTSLGAPWFSSLLSSSWDSAGLTGWKFQIFVKQERGAGESSKHPCRTQASLFTHTHIPEALSTQHKYSKISQNVKKMKQMEFQNHVAKQNNP